MGRVLALVGVLIAVGVGAWLYMRQAQAVAPAGTTNIRATVDVVGVKNDLISIANAERRRYASSGKYASLDDLRSNGDISMPSSSRGPYTYAVDFTDTSFHVTATCSGAACTGAPQSLSIDDGMQITSQ